MTADADSTKERAYNHLRV